MNKYKIIMYSGKEHIIKTKEDLNEKMNIGRKLKGWLNINSSIALKRDRIESIEVINE